MASKRGHGLTDKEGVEVGRRVALPTGAERPYSAFINGVLQDEGDDYIVEGREIVFSEPIVKEGKLGGLRWLSISLGLVGSYRKHETVDVEYHLAGKPHLASDLEPIDAAE